MNDVDNIHRDSYYNFWKSHFPTVWEGFLNVLLKNQESRLDFQGPIKVDNVELTSDLEIKGKDPVLYCRERNIDLTQSLSVNVKMDCYGKTQTLHVGQIPMQTREGQFIFNGKCRFILAQLVHSPGLQFHKEKVTKKYRFNYEYYNVDWTIFKGYLIPSNGVWLQFEKYKLDRDQPIDKLPPPLRLKVQFYDGHIKVVIRRKYWFTLSELCLALGIQDINIPEIDDEDDWALPSKEKDEYGNIRRGWTEIAQCLGINVEEINNEKLKDNIIKSQIQTKLLHESKLSPLARYQINRRLKKLGNNFNATDTSHITKEDILGIIDYLNMLHAGHENDVLLDSRRSLANKRVRLLGDLMKEEVMPRVLSKIRRRIIRRIEKAAENGERVTEKNFIHMLEEECRTNTKFLESIKDHFFITLTPLSALVSNENVLERRSLNRRITLFGPAGLPSSYIKDVRDIHWSHYGRLCPVDTPQSEKLGATLSVPLNARVNSLGLLESPFHEVRLDGDRIVISDELTWLSAADEEDRRPWIAYFDQIEFLKERKAVWARKGTQEFCRIDAASVNYIDADPLQPFSLAPRLIPFVQHDDANRVLMACSAMRQALTLNEKEVPLVRTSYEKLLSDEKNPWCYGCNLLSAYMPYKGLNFEDAIVVSESAAQKLSAFQYDVREIELREYSVLESKKTKKDNAQKKRRIVRWITTRDLPNIDHRKENLDENGVIKKGAWVEPGNILVGVIDPYKKKSIPLRVLAARSLRGESISPWNRSLVVPHDRRGKVISVDVYSRDKGDHLPSGVWQLVRVTLALEKPLEVGDKLTNRHGGKGVISAIIDDEKMPYFTDPASNHTHDDIGPHTHIEIIMNPLGVISRLNLGQLYETHLGWKMKRAGNNDGAIVDSFINSKDVLHLFREEKVEAAKVEDEQKQLLFDPETNEQIERPVTVGYIYILRLLHLAGEKVHGRGFARFAYNPVSEQPLQGKIHQGGQRMGEMEIWGLQAYNVKKIIQETITVKSDNPYIRDFLHKAQITTSAAPNMMPQPPEMLRVLYLFLFCMGLKMEFRDEKEKLIENIFDTESDILQKIAAVSIRPIDTNECMRLAAGEVTDPFFGAEADGYSDQGLFSQPVFGPLVDGMCKCGTIIPSTAFTGKRCDKCGVEITKRDTRRYKLGYIKLAYPVFNVIFLDVACKLFGLSRFRIKDFLMENVKEPPLKFAEPLDTTIFLWLALNASEEIKKRISTRLNLVFNDDDITLDDLKSMIGGDVNFINALPSKEILEGISSIDLLKKILVWLTPERLQIMAKALRYELDDLAEREVREDRQDQLRRRLDVIHSFLHSNVRPASMMFEVLPVLPPDLRKPFTTSKGITVIGELNQLYRVILECNQSILDDKRKEQKQKKNIRALQRRVSALIDNSRAYPPLYDSEGRCYRQSLAFFMKGKKGFFRGNLLGKRVDYSGRAVIVPDPSLKMDQCGIPYAMAVAIFKPVLINKLREVLAEQHDTKRNYLLNYRTTNERLKKTLESIPENQKSTRQYKEIEQDKERITEILNKFGEKYPIILNRQPTLHRLGIQAFHFRVNSHNAVSIHPLVTAGFNADFDGDTIAVYRLVTQDAIAEAPQMMASNNVISPTNGSVTLNLSQDVALGIYLETSTSKGRNHLAETTGFDVGDSPMGGRAFKQYLKRQLPDCQNPQKTEIIDSIKAIAFEKVTASGITLSISDMPNLAAERDKLISHKDPVGEMDRIVGETLNRLSDNPISIIRSSGARGDISTLRQLIGMRGKMERVTEEGGQFATTNVWSSLREGMTLGEYFVSCYGSRTTLVDKKMGTAEAGYITRQLVEMMQSIRISEADCTSKDSALAEGIIISEEHYEWLDAKDMGLTQLIASLSGKHVSTLVWDISNKKTDFPIKLEMIDRLCNQGIINKISQKDPQIKLLGVKIKEMRSIRELKDKLYGRVLLSTVTVNGKNIEGYLIDNENVSEQLANYILEKHTPLMVRSSLTCKGQTGVCQQCYGLDISTGKFPEIGSKVGIIAAQSIGEPGTQLVLRTFHHGGVMGMDSISKDIPKVQRYLHANSLAQLIAEFQGIEVSSYTELFDAIKQIYVKNDADVADHHFEILLKSMLNKVKINTQNDSIYYPGQIVEKTTWDRLTDKPEAQPVISSINMLQKYPTSWLSSASFGGVLNALAYSAIRAQADPLLGLKENIILGKLIP